jgi:hypothetical protein
VGGRVPPRRAGIGHRTDRALAHGRAEDDEVTDYAPLDFSIEQVSDDWEELASAGREVMQHMDTGRWLAGDLALRVEKKYGTDALGKYASDIGITSRETLKKYRQVSERYEKGTRGAFPALSWTHFRDAMRAKDDAELWLVQAQDNGWPSAVMARAIAAAIGARVPPRKLWEGQADTEKLQYSLYGAVLYLRGDDDFQWADLPSGARVIVKVYAAEAE